MILQTIFILNCLSVAAQDTTIPSMPNILFAIADDWGVHASAYGTPWVKTPNFDRVAKQGILFRNALHPMPNALHPVHAFLQVEILGNLKKLPTIFVTSPKNLRAGARHFQKINGRWAILQRVGARVLHWMTKINPGR